MIILASRLDGLFWVCFWHVCTICLIHTELLVIVFKTTAIQIVFWQQKAVLGETFTHTHTHTHTHTQLGSRILKMLSLAICSHYISKFLTLWHSFSTFRTLSQIWEHFLNVLHTFSALGTFSQLFAHFLLLSQLWAHLQLFAHFLLLSHNF